MKTLQLWQKDWILNKIKDELKHLREELETEEDMERCGHLEEAIADLEETYSIVEEI
jgi:hypothetical protein